MGRIFKTYIEAPSLYVCNDCATHVVASDSIISKQFHGRHGKAYLFEDVVNVTLGPTEERMLLTGIHQVADFYCNGCDKALGWKYKHATDPSQKYKEGKYIVEKAMVKKTLV